MIQGIAITPFDATAILIVLAAALGHLNYRFLGLPQSVGLTVMGAVASPIVVGVDGLSLSRADCDLHRCTVRGDRAGRNDRAADRLVAGTVRHQ